MKQGSSHLPKVLLWGLTAGSILQGTEIQVTVRQDRGQVHFAAAAAGFGRPRHAHIPRWHFDMVLDTQRNAAYQAAIHRAIELKRAAGEEAIYVLDIGAGSGILSLMAARLGPVTQWSCLLLSPC